MAILFRVDYTEPYEHDAGPTFLNREDAEDFLAQTQSSSYEIVEIEVYEGPICRTCYKRWECNKHPEGSNHA